MNQGPDSFETELSALRPAKPSREAMDRLETKLSHAPSSASSSPASAPRRRGLNWILWLAPAAAAATVGILLFGRWAAVSIKPLPTGEPVSQPGLRADKVEIDRQLMTNFDAIARLPSGEPVRFRCEDWRSGPCVSKLTEFTELLRYETFYFIASAIVLEFNFFTGADHICHQPALRSRFAGEDCGKCTFRISGARRGPHRSGECFRNHRSYG